MKSELRYSATLLVGLGASIVGACSSPTPSEQMKNAVNAHKDGAPDAKKDASKDAGGVDGGLPCLASASDECADAQTAGCHWPSDAMAFCTVPKPLPRPRSITICNEIRTVSYRDVDAAWWVYYDGATGEFVAQVSYMAVGNRLRCDVGPPRFFEPTKCTDGKTFHCPAADSGAGGSFDGGHGGASGDGAAGGGGTRDGAP